jgi:hypothetical protein
MVEKKTGTSAKPQTGQPPSSSASEQPRASEPGAKEGRKPWIKKTPVEVVLEQIGKQESRVNELREELKQEERELQKLQQAKKILESTS